MCVISWRYISFSFIPCERVEWKFCKILQFFLSHHDEVLSAVRSAIRWERVRLSLFLDGSCKFFFLEIWSLRYEQMANITNPRQTVFPIYVTHRNRTNIIHAMINIVRHFETLKHFQLMWIKKQKSIGTFENKKHSSSDGGE